MRFVLQGKLNAEQPGHNYMINYLPTEVAAVLMSGLAEEVVELDKLFLGIFISKRGNMNSRSLP